MLELLLILLLLVCMSGLNRKRLTVALSPATTHPRPILTETNLRYPTGFL